MNEIQCLNLVNSIATACFVLPGRPKTYHPPRFKFKGKMMNVYAMHNKPLKSARDVLADQMHSPVPLRDVPLLVHIELHFKRPKCHFKKGQLRDDAPKFVLKTPDVDNCTKFVLDALQPRVISDDKFVTKVVVEKMWCLSATTERTDIELHLRM